MLHRLSRQDLRLLEILARKLRVLTLPQGAEALGVKPRALLERARRLESLGLVRVFEVFVSRTVASARVALATPSDAPDFAYVVRDVKRKWVRAGPPAPKTVIAATRAGGTLAAGVGGRPPRTSEGPHDVFVAAVYLALSRAEPEVAATWVSEDRLIRRGFGEGENLPGENLPDALVERAGTPTAIEIVGSSYTASKLSALWNHCKRNGLLLEIW